MSWLSWIVANLVLATLLAAAAWLVQRLRQEGLARLLWICVLIKLISPPIFSVPLYEAPRASLCDRGLCGCHAHAPLRMASDALPWALLATWTAGASATAWNAWRHWAQFRRLLAHTAPAPQAWQSLAARLCDELALRRPPELLIVPGRLPPLVVAGWPRARLLVPKALANQLGTQQQEALLLHELAHIKHADHLMRLLELVISVAYWWLPIAQLIGRQLRVCEESRCDATVLVRRPHLRRDYACLLLDVLDFVSPAPLHAIQQVTAMSAAHDLERRLRAILTGGQEKRRMHPGGIFVAVLACAILPCGLDYDLSRWTAPAAPSSLPASADGAKRLQSADGFDESPVFCCPS